VSLWASIDVILAAAPYAIQAVINATSTIPIVGIDLESDPVARGWVKSLARPEGNFTGFFLDIPELGGKQIELLKEAVPTVARLAVLWDATIGTVQFRATETAARPSELTLESFPIRNVKTSTMASSGPRVNNFMGWWSSLRR
jgi:ABC-type uncharacterized transport system substrate-binding protein